LLIPNVVRTWAPKGETPYLYHLYRQERLSAISALSVSPKKKRLALYLQLRKRNIKGLDVHSFLESILKHLKGHVFLLWDRGSVHRCKKVQQFIIENPRLHLEYFPAYAPELNPTEYVWNQSDRALSNTAPKNLGELRGNLRKSIRNIRGSQKLLWSCIYASDLPWTR
jgi:transposase